MIGDLVNRASHCRNPWKHPKLSITSFKYNLFPFFQRADAAIADLTMTKERMDVVDFTVPFMNTGNVPLYCTIWEDLFTLIAHDFTLSFRGVNLVLEGWAASQCSLQY